MGFQAAEQVKKNAGFGCQMKTYRGKIKKKITVKLIGDAEQAFQGLNRIVGEQHNKGITSSKEITLLDAINRIFDILAGNPFDAENLFIADLPDYWRMIYTLESDEIEIIAFVLDIIDHEKYDKKFGFRKR